MIQHLVNGFMIFVVFAAIGFVQNEDYKEEQRQAEIRKEHAKFMKEQKQIAAEWNSKYAAK